MGDIGIFVIEIRLVMELCSLPSQASSTQKRLRELFAPANLWIQCKSASRLVIVLSKTDDKRISNFSILCAKEFLHDMKDFEKIPVIATGINVPMCQGINILDSDLKRDGMQNEESLLEALRHIQEKLVQTNDLGDQSIASIDRIFKHTKQLKAPAIRIKVQSGNLKIKDTVALGPVLYRDKIVTLKGKIISLMDEGSHKRVPVLMKNGIGGIVFSKLQYNKEIISLKDVSLLGTTLLWKKPINMRYENVLTFSVPESTAAQTLAARQVISLIFFGKKIPLKILSCSFQKSNYRIRLMNPHPTDLLPFPLLLRPDGTFCYKEYVLQYNGRFLVADLKEVSRITDEDPREVMLCLRNNHSEDSELIGSGAKTVFVESENITIIDFPSVGRKRFLELASYPLADSADFDDIKPKPLRDAGNYCASQGNQKKNCAKPVDQLPI